MDLVKKAAIGFCSLVIIGCGSGDEQSKYPSPPPSSGKENPVEAPMVKIQEQQLVFGEWAVMSLEIEYQDGIDFELNVISKPDWLLFDTENFTFTGQPTLLESKPSIEVDFKSEHHQETFLFELSTVEPSEYVTLNFSIPKSSVGDRIWLMNVIPHHDPMTRPTLMHSIDSSQNAVASFTLPREQSEWREGYWLVKWERADFAPYYQLVKSGSEIIDSFDDRMQVPYHLTERLLPTPQTSAYMHMLKQRHTGLDVGNGLIDYEQMFRAELQAVAHANIDTASWMELSSYYDLARNYNQASPRPYVDKINRVLQEDLMQTYSGPGLNDSLEKNLNNFRMDNVVPIPDQTWEYWLTTTYHELFHNATDELKPKNMFQSVPVTYSALWFSEESNASSSKKEWQSNRPYEELRSMGVSHENAIMVDTAFKASDLSFLSVRLSFHENDTPYQVLSVLEENHLHAFYTDRHWSFEGIGVSFQDRSVFPSKSALSFSSLVPLPELYFEPDLQDLILPMPSMDGENFSHQWVNPFYPYWLENNHGDHLSGWQFEYIDTARFSLTNQHIRVHYDVISGAMIEQVPGEADLSPITALISLYKDDLLVSEFASNALIRPRDYCKKVSCDKEVLHNKIWFDTGAGQVGLSEGQSKPNSGMIFENNQLKEVIFELDCQDGSCLLLEKQTASVADVDFETTKSGWSYISEGKRVEFVGYGNGILWLIMDGSVISWESIPH